ncbi:MAG: hypothetical protein WBI57_00005, partial [Desulfobacterales bacterium]
YSDVHNVFLLSLMRSIHLNEKFLQYVYAYKYFSRLKYSICKIYYDFYAYIDSFVKDLFLFGKNHHLFSWLKHRN